LTAIVSVGGPEGKINLTLPGNQREAKAAEIGKLSAEGVEYVYGDLYEDEDETYGGQVTLGEYDPRVRKEGIREPLVACRRMVLGVFMLYAGSRKVLREVLAS